VIAIADYGMGNRRSVEKALEHVGAPVVRTADAGAIAAADAIVLPGVGAFPEAMRRLRTLEIRYLRGAPNTRESSQIGITMTAPSRK